MPDWLPPDAQWDVHGSKFWRDTLNVARAKGWHLLRLSSHGWGRIACKPNPDGLPTDDVCSYDVDSTARSSEWHAQLALGKVVGCPHRDEEDEPEDDVATAGRLLHDANRMLDGAERLIAERRHLLDLVDIEGLLDDAEQYADRADELWDRAEWAETDANTAHEQAMNHLGAARYVGEAEASPVIDDAESRVAEAEAAAPGNDAIKSRVRDTRARIEDLRRQLHEL